MSEPLLELEGRDAFFRLVGCKRVPGSVSKVEMVTIMALIYKGLCPSISTFETPPVFVS